MSPRLLHYSDVENAYDNPDRIGRLAGLLRERDGPDALVVGTGDNTSPGVLPLVEEGGQSIPFFRAVGADLETFGNHDFDYGPDRTLELVADSPQTWLTANVERDGGRFGAGVGTAPWTVEEVDGERVGFFGVTVPTTPSINPNATDLAFGDPITAAEEAVAALRERGVDRVVALSHLGTEDRELAVETGVDVVLGGHVHTEVVERVGDTLLTRPGVNGETLLEVDLATGSVTRHAVTGGPVDESVAGELRRRMAETGLDEVVATVEDPIERTEGTVMRGESRIGNLVADAYRWATGADVALQNSGGIRAGPALSGEVTVSDLVSVVPFKEPVAVTEVTGERLLAALRQASGATVSFGEPDWWHAHLSGANVVWDRSEDRIREATVDGDPVDPDENYTLATSAYVFHTDHEFPALAGEGVLDTGRIQYEVLADYAREVGIDPELEGRILRVG
ncbi:bifunctional metallophosphatase/5'-nucleotidase [Halobacteriales archaeon QS_8_69_26]|nr:MAG: bifunctional metallophosphatase/5'-nucleotidase [Halobacteriales archaeon QS_8_69_26]